MWIFVPVYFAEIDPDTIRDRKEKFEEWDFEILILVDCGRNRESWAKAIRYAIYVKANEAPTYRRSWNAMLLARISQGIWNTFRWLKFIPSFRRYDKLLLPSSRSLCPVKVLQKDMQVKFEDNND